MGAAVDNNNGGNFNYGEVEKDAGCGESDIIIVMMSVTLVDDKI